jgi:hypothetical protein
MQCGTCAQHAVGVVTQEERIPVAAGRDERPDERLARALQLGLRNVPPLECLGLDEGQLFHGLHRTPWFWADSEVEAPSQTTNPDPD